jgi:hypothetical protein
MNKKSIISFEIDDNLDSKKLRLSGELNVPALDAEKIKSEFFL